MSRPSDFATSSSSDVPSTTGRETIRRVLPYLWPKGEGWVKRRVVAALHRQLRPGGWMFIGHSESLNGVTDSYRQVRPTIYRKERGA